jgi:hypothetical protein
MLLTLIKTALSAVTAYFNASAAVADLSGKKLIYDLIEQSEKRQTTLQAQIESNRQLGTEYATANADMLFKVLQKERLKHEKYLNNIDGSAADFLRNKV